MPTNRLDNIYRSVVLTKYFVKGWGKSDILKRLFEWRKVATNRDVCYTLVPSDYPVTIEKEVRGSDYYLIEGYFTSPLVHYLPDIMPPECEKAYFQFILPTTWKHNNFKPVCISLAGTGDHYFWRRRTLLSKPLIKEACIGSVLLENPFYGHRKPKDQVRSILHNVSDILVMGGCLMLESLVLFHLCERLGLGPLGVTGLSMGGHMASLAATNWPKPLIVVPCLSGTTASVAFTQGAISGAIDWKMLEKQFHSDISYKEEIKQMLYNNDDAFRAGQQFAKHLTNRENQSYWVGKLGKDGILTNINSGASLSSPEMAMDSNVARLLESTAKKINLDIEPSLNDQLNTNKKKVSKKELNTLLSKITSNPFSFSGSQSLENNDKQSDGSNLLEVNEREAFNFMRGIMDECTHLKNYCVPVDTSLCISVCAQNDGYVPYNETESIKDIWPNAEIRCLKGGHVSVYLRNQKDFRNAIIDGFNKYREKYGSPL